MKQYKGYNKIIIGHSGSTPAYIQATTKCLDEIEKIPTGRKLLTKINQYPFTKTIRNIKEGNSHEAKQYENAFPKLVAAIAKNHARDFALELSNAFEIAKRRGMPLEHFARQLSMGMTPVTYDAARENVVKPSTKFSFGKFVFGQKHEIDSTIQRLQHMMRGDIPLSRIPADWRYHLPRLLRDHMTPGVGSDSQVNFNPYNTFNCPHDRAMHQRPPVIGLAHELIHGLHASQGLLMSLVKLPSEQNLEELITTGLPPYHYEEISDNLLRTQWPTDLALRLKY